MKEQLSVGAGLRGPKSDAFGASVQGPLGTRRGRAYGVNGKGPEVPLHRGGRVSTRCLGMCGADCATGSAELGTIGELRSSSRLSSSVCTGGGCAR